jgi:hypothetical protein
MVRRAAAFEGLDDDHATAAARTRRLVMIGIKRIGGFAFGLLGCEQFTGERDVGGAGGLGQKTVVANAVEAARQDVDQEAADELVCCQRHQFVSIAAFDPIILPLEGDAAAVERDQAAVGDGDTVGVAREIGQHGLGSTERPLGIDHPFDLAQRCQVCREGLRIGERRVIAEELKLLL